MDGTVEKAHRQQEMLKGLLARGGTVFSLAMVSYSNSDTEDAGDRWSVLSPELVAGAEQIYTSIAGCVDADILSSALKSALSGTPRTALPSWVTPIFREPSCFSFFGENLPVLDLSAALGPRHPRPSKREKGMAATALALCRRQDTLLTLANRMSDVADGRLLSRMGRLAYVTAAPGEPSRVRGMLRNLLKGSVPWDV